MADRYAPRHVPGGMPAEVCEYGVVDMASGKEICRAWSADAARNISNALNSAEWRRKEIEYALRAARITGAA